MFYHVTTKSNWQQAQVEGELTEPSLAAEGFIHCCSREQLAGVGSRYFKGQPDLVVLLIDPAKLKHELKYDLATNNEYFPHIYGTINTDAVVSVEDIVF